MTGLIRRTLCNSRSGLVARRVKRGEGNSLVDSEHRPRLLVACCSEHRSEWYRLTLTSFGFDVSVAAGGLDCVALLRRLPQLLLLEAELAWGGADGVLAIRQEEAALRDIPVVLAAIDGVSASVYQLARYSIQGYFSRIPAAKDLAGYLHHALRNSQSPDHVASV